MKNWKLSNFPSMGFPLNRSLFNLNFGYLFMGSTSMIILFTPQEHYKQLLLILFVEIVVNK